MPSTVTDLPLDHARDIVAAGLANPAKRPVVKSFFDEQTFTISHVVRDPKSNACAVIDSVLDYDPASGRTASASAQALIDYIKSESLNVHWLLETHAHADHLSAAPLLQAELGGQLAIGREIVRVQQVFGKIFNAGTEFQRDGSQFDQLFNDGDRFSIGTLDATVLHVPGHTPACLAYVIGNAVFPGDTLFMPDYGTARCDFPGGDARQLYRSIRRLMKLPDDARMFLCHDYKAPGRDSYAWETTIGAQRIGNVHVHEGVSEGDFYTMRTERDATLAMPRLILPSVQVNMRGGQLPPAEDNGVQYLKIPLNVL
ncbi:MULTISPECIES: MBL fold metallo-hydrolase [Rhizobium/Agrobacterium group]|uniref:MBL fold metallo-hydrolase n=2 Tax=Rhizobium/Agrobacterium group TaxID=227290 RepID=A0A9X3KS50_9HYPH|nr:MULTISPECIES: MBL fold metallo-hydrolase [Rhizobium/Agrobacterium group]MBO9126253.1 MBL fold metallo-hydrolase [Rhizobium sp. 16-488-2b]MBO9176837.1 MBL fold metallo-hydrolase [Rhizobium sp. 16-488-2a]MBO9197406.1 MBL fold metallo-hydrolase [Rhizobium sp. 16-449-1b]MCZ7466728.1 MBL fold metallo-hydrolase [Rhizobium rhizogenes]MCZ7939238.1 MBL fold metallo-hydrolase [Agrobacterium salinitolerans]